MQQPDTGAVKFETTLQLVVEMVSVTDKNGKTVEGLTAKDFTVTEDGKPQEIRFCEYQKLADDAPPPPPARRRRRALPRRLPTGALSRKGSPGPLSRLQSLPF